MTKQDYINAFNSFNDSIDLEINHTGIVGTVHVTTAAEYFEMDEDWAEEGWANWLYSEGLELNCSLEDALNDNFPEDIYNVSLKLTYESSNDAVQDENAIEELKRILKGVLDKLDKCSPTDDYISEDVKDLNGNVVGELTLSIEAE
jgi:hypothetical protein